MLTAQQHRTYQFIRKFMFQHGYAPTEAEIAEGIGIKSRGVVHRYVTALIDAGMITTTPNKRRNINLNDDLESMDGIPIVGKIAAGCPIEAIADHRVINVAEKLLGPKRYILEVTGDSMIGDNICDGDYIICEQANTAADGTIVIALIDNEDATLKRLRRNPDNSVTLLPSNPRLHPLVYAADRVKVQGVYIGLFRLNGN